MQVPLRRSKRAVARDLPEVMHRDTGIRHQRGASPSALRLPQRFRLAGTRQTDGFHRGPAQDGDPQSPGVSVGDLHREPPHAHFAHLRNRLHNISSQRSTCALAPALGTHAAASPVAEQARRHLLLSVRKQVRRTVTGSINRASRLRCRPLRRKRSLNPRPGFGVPCRRQPRSRHPAPVVPRCATCSRPAPPLGAAGGSRHRGAGCRGTSEIGAGSAWVCPSTTARTCPVPGFAGVGLLPVSLMWTVVEPPAGTWKGTDA